MDKEYVFYLSPERVDRFRYFHRMERGKIVRFRDQYEAWIENGWRPIVRHGTVHGYPHRDLLHPNRSADKREFRGYTVEEVLTLGERDLKANWRRYRDAYEQEMQQ